MSNDPNAPLTGLHGGLWLQRAVGAAVLLVGLALGGLFMSPLFQLLASGSVARAFLLGYLAVVGLLAAFFLHTGWRLVFDRPNRHGSLLPPALWFTLAALFLAGGLVAAVLLLAQRRFADLDAVASALALALLAALAGHRAMKARRHAG